MKRLLTIGHSYVVAANRQLAHHMAVQGRGLWEVTALAPARYRGDLRTIDLEPIANEACTLRAVPVRLDRIPHLMSYGGSACDVLHGDWDVVHCWEEPYTRSAAQVARRIAPHAKLVVASFQNISKRYPWPLRAYERETMRRANGWVAFGETVHTALRGRAGYGDLPSCVIPPGVDQQRFRDDAVVGASLRQRLGWPADALVVGYLGRFVEQKGLNVLMAALGPALGDGRCHVLLVGGGPLEPALRRFAADYPGRVHVQTGVPHDEVPAWLNAMSVLCAPSQTTRGWREQFGRMLVEAMACGVPVVASDSGEMPAVVGEAGVIVPETDVRAWSAAIAGLLADTARRLDLRARGTARAARFAWPTVAREHLAFFEQVLQA